MSVRLFQYKV